MKAVGHKIQCNPGTIRVETQCHQLLEPHTRRADRTQHQQGMAEMADSGALVVDTGKFKGRAPKDKYTVKDAKPKTRWTGTTSIFRPTMPPSITCTNKVMAYLADKDVWVRDAYACADPEIQTEHPGHQRIPPGQYVLLQHVPAPTAEEITP